MSGNLGNTVRSAVITAVVVIFAVFSVATGNARAQQTHDTLCVFYEDLNTRYTDGLKFLADNPEGIPGISAAQIQQSLDNQQQTLEALSGLGC